VDTDARKDDKWMAAKVAEGVRSGGRGGKSQQESY